MKQTIERITINGRIYVAEDSLLKTENTMPDPTNGLYAIVRADRAGVFAGYLANSDGAPITTMKNHTLSENASVYLRNARWIWHWEGAASLSQLSIDGTSQPDTCKFPDPVDFMQLFGVIQIIPGTEKARKSIEGVKPWKM